MRMNKILVSMAAILVALLPINGAAKGVATIAAEAEAHPTFDNDDDFLDYIEKVHFNYMWEGAEANSGCDNRR